MGVLEASDFPAQPSANSQTVYVWLGQIASRNLGAVPWKLAPVQTRRTYQPTALVDGWEKFAISHSSIRLEIEAPWDPFDAIWLLERFSDAEIGIASVFLAKEKRSHERWHWPVRIGVLPSDFHAVRRSIDDEIRGKHWHHELAEVLELGETNSRSDLLIIPHGPRAALARILSTPPLLRATAVLLVGATDISRAETVRLLKSIDDELFTNAVALISQTKQPLGRWLHDLMTELSHDHPFDLALSNSLGLPSERPSFLLLANGSWADDMRVSNVANSLTEKLRRPELRRQLIQVDSDLARSLSHEMSINVRPGEHIIADLPPMLRLYDREARGATTLSRFTKAVRHQLRTVEPMPEQRRLQAQVFEELPAAPAPPVTFFRAGALHRVDVRVGLPEQEWICANQVFPTEKLPPSKRGHVLTVVFVEPDLAADPQVDHIFLPHTGSSETCSFYLQIPTDAHDVHARVTVSYKNRILQTSILEGTVRPHSKPDPKLPVIRFTPEVVVSPGMSDLDRQSSYDAALVFNHTKRGAARVLKLVDDSAGLVSTGSLLPTVQAIEDALANCDWSSASYRSLTGKGTLSLLRVLAAHGTLLYRGVIKQQLADSQLANAKKIQLIAAKPGARLPVEYFYDRPSPGPKAKLCPGAKRALKAGQCEGPCTSRESAGMFVCPLGFWGMRKVLEWHSFRPESAGELQGRDYALQQTRIASRKQLRPLEHAIVGASDRANSEVKNSVPKLLAFIKKSKVPNRFVNTWPEWKKHIGTDSPSLLVLIPHTDVDGTLNVPMMEIGKQQWLTLNQLDEDYIHVKKVQPIVLLLGCETAQQHVTFEDFISNFSIQGAAIVVASSTSILGRQAAPLAAEFVRVLKTLIGGNGATFGDVMLTVRRNVMQKGYPMVLSVSSYGDADWRL
jgi:hypothetical protein